MQDSKIEWTRHTFNPWFGCSKVHTGCLNCYAETLMADRYKKVTWGPNGTRRMTSESNWSTPLSWNGLAKKAAQSAKVFCASLADMFEDWGGKVQSHRGLDLYVADEEPDRWVEMPLGGPDALLPGERANFETGIYTPVKLEAVRQKWLKLVDKTPWLDWLVLTKRPENAIRMLGKPRKNLWIGTSVSDQETADKLLPELAKCRNLSPVLFCSYEPATGPLDLRPHVHGLDWVIIGGESGSGARQFDLSWGYDVLMECILDSIPVFMKQMGANAVSDGCGIKFIHTHGADPSEWPNGWAIREFPKQDIGCTIHQR
jgi:protein gp37